MRTKSEMDAALREHQKKYPFRLGGMPMKDWFELEEKERDEELDAINNPE